MSGARFTPAQRRILVALATAVAAVFGLLGYTVYTTLQQPSIQSVFPSAIPVSISVLSSPTPTATPTASATTPQPSPTPTSRPTPATPLSQIQSARAVREVGRIVAEVRELPPVEQIPVTFPTEHEVAISLLKTYQEDPPQVNLPLYATLGVIPRIDPLPLPDVTAQAQHISSLYLPAGRQILLVAGRGPANVEDEWALVHALAHALQDQVFGLEELQPCYSTTDSALALRALIEGDAVLTTVRYAGLEGEEALERLGRMATDAEEPTYAPLAGEPLFERLRAFPYVEGARWATALFEKGGWRAVDQAYGLIPCSTEQILHPDRYIDRESPQPVTLPDLTPILGTDWSLVQEDTLGEWILGLHLVAYLDGEGRAWEAVEGWAGDLFTLWQDEEGKEIVVWRTLWDDRDEAEQFEQAYRLVVPRLRIPPLVAAENPYRLPGRLWEGVAGAAYVERTGRIVTVIWGPDIETVVAVARALP